MARSIHNSSARRSLSSQRSFVPRSVAVSVPESPRQAHRNRGKHQNHDRDQRATTGGFLTGRDDGSPEDPYNRLKRLNHLEQSSSRDRRGTLRLLKVRRCLHSPYGSGARYDPRRRPPTGDDHPVDTTPVALKTHGADTLRRSPARRSGSACHDQPDSGPGHAETRRAERSTDRVECAGLPSSGSTDTSRNA